ncbi:ABC transporter substrate-binding protein [Tenacibaculum finnmarkense]|uniref:ABC transporter substrate-binding protein n=1 Tax=Tenacibaculum finnmarkense TaxID=2781243 RepID=UPI001E5879C6|nr:ABC transporter substrate-binding protein [Tenacibaculum finnmarkense]MCD8422381.1 ABC transporter substrate-binding protein [Tenacibaculum finnmarkense genomovar ulcerans]MCG8238387.1 ABC transporter substrate-binding protein [Tenacibaculum finnmarkense genomovar ulcerans]MCG8749066.1 ABC transporter substrate-binding protein [Tenacibaculum finnmarkense]MCG8754123.1 ABC transporter substrate-binding protein [Tenacibaculum finnmarkense]MCG8782690.1 ABC transporter substrate-binding protein 
MKHFFTFIIISLFFIQCKNTDKKEPQHQNKQEKKAGIYDFSSIKYAKGFDIITENNQKKLIIKKVFQNSKKQFEFILTNKTDISKNELKIPVKKLVVTSTTHIPMLELLNSENTLIGFPHTKYISSKKTRKIIDTGHIIELGNEQNMNTEKLLELQPELVVGFSLHPNSKLYENIKKAGIPVVFNGDWLEETPLGRAEWIKFFGVLLNKEKQADSIFNAIEKSYLDAKNTAQKSPNYPSILSGSMFKEVWNLPGGNSFMATFFKDAHLDYLWKETNNSGSLQLSFESVLDKGKTADFWLGCGFYQTKNEILNTNKHYKEFDALKNGNTYTIGTKKGKTGGLIYFELAPTRPDLVLKDLIKITNPTALPDYELTFFERLQ